MGVPCARPPPDAASASCHLALGARTVEGRLSGLAGLELVDPEVADEVLCAVRATLPPRATGLTSCAAEELDVAELIEPAAPDAIRGEPHWSEAEWLAALADGTPDVRGGALARRLLYSGSEGETTTDLAMPLAEGGLVPPLDPSAPPPPRVQTGTRGEHAPPWVGRSTGACAVRDDGRVACWGGSRPVTSRDAPPVVLLPDVLRFPRALVERGQRGCMLDAAGRRVCWGGLELAAERLPGRVAGHRRRRRTSSRCTTTARGSGWS